MGDDPLEIIKLKFKRADEHLGELGERIEAFHKSGVYEIVIDNTIDDHEWIAIKQTEEPPRIISIVVGEIVYQLRSILDHWACAMARQHSGSDSGVYFPFAGSRQEFDRADTQRKMSKLPADARDIICNHLKPYKGGNDFLWSLSRIGNIDRHRSNIGMNIFGYNLTSNMKVALPAGMNSFHFRTPFVPEITHNANGFSFQFPKPIGTLSQQQIALVGFPAGAVNEGEAEIAFHVTFRDTDIVGGHPVFTTTQQYFQLVRKICIGFDAAFFTNADKGS